MFGGIICAYAGYEREHFVVFEIVFGENTGCQFLSVKNRRHHPCEIEQLLAVFVIIDAQSGGQAMVVIHLSTSLKIELAEGVQVGVELVRFPCLDAVQIVEIMVADGGYDRHGRTAFFIEDIAVFEKSLYAPGVEVDVIRIDNRVRQLSAPSSVVQTAYEGLESIVIVLVEPAVGEVSILHFGHVHKGVVVTVHAYKTSPVVRQDAGIEVVFELPTAHDIGFRHGLGIDHKVDTQRVLGLRFEHFNIDLSGDRFVAVDDGRGTFADLNTAHPRTGDILESEVLRKASNGWRVLLDELHIGTAEPEQTNLLRTGSCIGIGDIDGGVGLEGFAEVAAGGTAQLFRVDFLGIKGFRAALDLAFLALHDGDFLNLEITRFLCRHACTETNPHK